MGSSLSLRGALALPLAACAAACAVDPTEVLVVVDSDYAVPTELTDLGLRISFEGAGVATDYQLRLAGAGAYHLPLSFGVGARDPNARATIEVTGFGPDGAARVTRRAVTGFVEGRSIRLPMFIGRGCAGVSCAEQETCTERGCALERIDPSTLEVVAPGAELTIPIPRPDAGPIEAGVMDAAPVSDGDAGPADSRPDAGDAAALDAGRADARPGDAATADAGLMDSGRRADAATADAALRDAGRPVDAAGVDAARSDAGLADAGFADAAVADAAVADAATELCEAGPCPPLGFVRIAAGTFTMGSPLGERARATDETQHSVTITRSFWLQAAEVTQGEYEALFGLNPSNFTACGDTCPVENVSWDDSVSYANALSTMAGLEVCYGGGEGSWTFAGLSCTGYRLPTEAEWEYAARAGSITAFHRGDISRTGCSVDPNLTPAGWYCANAGGTTHPGRRKAANAWGLYDMEGNVAEWVHDWLDVYPVGPATDPVGPVSGVDRVIRGGHWNNYAEDCRSANRVSQEPPYHLDGLGFRLARSIP